MGAGEKVLFTIFTIDLLIIKESVERPPLG
jgi:hypothetical protein